MIRFTSLAALAAALAAVPAAAQTAPAGQPTAQAADALAAAAEKQLEALSVPTAQISWVNATYITDDTDALAAVAGARITELAVKFAVEAAKYRQIPACRPTRSASSTCCSAASRFPRRADPARRTRSRRW